MDHHDCLCWNYLHFYVIYNHYNILSFQPTSASWLVRVDEMMDLVAEQKWTKGDLFTIRRKVFRNETPKPGEESYRKFKELYESLTPLPTFDSLPTPIGALDRINNKTKEKLPSYISSKKFKYLSKVCETFIRFKV